MLNSNDIQSKNLLMLAEKAKPYVEFSNKQLLVETIRKNRTLEEQFKNSPKRQEFLKKVSETGQVYYVVNYESQKYPFQSRKGKYPNVRVYVGMREEIPVISLQI